MASFDKSRIKLIAQIFINSLDLLISMSSLPDIFKQSMTMPLKIQKQGGFYSLHLETSSLEKNIINKQLSSIEVNYYSSQAGKKTRYSSMRALRQESTFKIDNKRTIIDFTSRNKSGKKVGFSAHFDELKNMLGGNKKIDMSIFTNSQIPYETGRRFNNTNIEMEEAESLNNKVQNGIKQMVIIKQSLNESKQTYFGTKMALLSLQKTIQSDLINFNLQFSKILKTTYTKLSSFRRQTNQEQKANTSTYEKVKYQIYAAGSILQDIQKTADHIYSECLQGSEDKLINPLDYLSMDFGDEISSIRKSSRGLLTGEANRKQLLSMIKDENNRKSASSNIYGDLGNLEGQQGKFILNGKQIDLLHIDEY